MVDKPQQSRTFVKEGPDGERLTRQVTSVRAEVEAKFDGFTEEAAKASGGSGNRSSSSGSSGSSS